MAEIFRGSVISHAPLETFFTVYCYINTQSLLSKALSFPYLVCKQHTEAAAKLEFLTSKGGL